jgi:hypothetical protein
MVLKDFGALCHMNIYLAILKDFGALCHMNIYLASDQKIRLLDFLPLQLILP